MLRKDKDDDQMNKGSAEEKPGADAMEAPPLKPFSKKGSHLPSKPPGPVAFQADAARGVIDIPSTPRRLERSRPRETEIKKLIVGREIRLSGEITSCDKLVVEGQVEASLSDARVIEVAPTGYFKGDAQVDEADISGRYEGELTAKDKLIVRSSGRISGSIRYGRIVIESGGEISGDMRSLSTAEGDAPKDAAAESSSQSAANAAEPDSE